MAKKKTKRGRPRLLDGEKVMVTGCSLPVGLVAFAKKIGDGNFSRGVRLALQAMNPIEETNARDD